MTTLTCHHCQREIARGPDIVEALRAADRTKFQVCGTGRQQHYYCEDCAGCCPGLTTTKPKVQEVHSLLGQHYWKATARIATVFGSAVEGGAEIMGLGNTRRQAIRRFEAECRRHAEALLSV